MSGLWEPEMLRLGQEDAAAAALCESHADYPAFRSIFPDPAQRRAALLPFLRATIRDAIPFGFVHGIFEGDRVLAVAVWLPPGAFPWSMRRKLAATPDLLRVFAAYPSAFRRFMRHGASLEHVHPGDPHWYLVTLGVRRDAQGKGLGTRLIEPMLSYADDCGDPCYLETSAHANISYYARFGFEVVEAKLQLLPDAPALVSMRRPRRHQPAAVGDREALSGRARE